MTICTTGLVSRIDSSKLDFLLITSVSSLADEASFLPTGLPEVPDTVTLVAPSFEEVTPKSFRHENGRYYCYPPPGEILTGPPSPPEPAVEKLRKSAAAADAVSKYHSDNAKATCVVSRDVVIAHGTSALDLAEMGKKGKGESRDWGSRQSLDWADMPETPKPQHTHKPSHTEASMPTAQSDADYHLSVSMDDLRRQSALAANPRSEAEAAGEPRTKRHSVPNVSPPARVDNEKPDSSPDGLSETETASQLSLPKTPQPA
jgi:hypothetical protein